MPRPSHPPWVDHRNNILWIPQVMKLSMLSSWLLCKFILFPCISVRVYWKRKHVIFEYIIFHSMKLNCFICDYERTFTWKKHNCYLVHLRFKYLNIQLYSMASFALRETERCSKNPDNVLQIFWHNYILPTMELHI
jgi:hypothetical protein